MRVTLTLSNNVQYDGTGHNNLVIEGLRTIAQVSFAGGGTLPHADIQIYGMSQSDMNSLTMLAWKGIDITERNRVLLEAWDNDEWVEVFKGDIVESGPDYAGMPEVFLRIAAASLYYDHINAVIPSSFDGVRDAKDIMSDLVGKVKDGVFENNGVSVPLKNGYYPSTLVEQIKTVAQNANIEVYVDGSTVAIAPRGQPRQHDAVLVSAATGMIGYPTIDKIGVHVKMLFNSKMRFGYPVKIESDVPRANGDDLAQGWRIYSLEHYLESERPHGSWFSQVGLSEFTRLPTAGI